MPSKDTRWPSINKQTKSVPEPVKPALEWPSQIPVTINKTGRNQVLKLPYVVKGPPNKIVQDTGLFKYGSQVNPTNKVEKKDDVPHLQPLESPMGKQDDDALEEFEHPVIDEKEKYENKVLPAKLPVIEISIEETNVNNDAPVTKSDPPNDIPTNAIEKDRPHPSHLDNDISKNKSQQQQHSEQKVVPILRDRTESEEELIKETVMLFLSEDNDDTSDYGVLPGQVVEESVRNKIGAIGKKGQILYPAKSEITVNRGLMTIITENMIVKVSSSKLIGYIAGASNESVILIFKKNNITVPIKNKDLFKTIIVSLDEILSKRSWCLPFFSFY